MRHFYGDLQGQAKTAATRRGSKNSGMTVLEYIKGDKPFQFEVWFSNKNHASYGLIYKNTHLEYARTGTI